MSGSAKLNLARGSHLPHVVNLAPGSNLMPVSKASAAPNLSGAANVNIDAHVRAGSYVSVQEKMKSCAQISNRHKINRRPRLLDLFCGAGGAGAGYFRAGFDVVGVDIQPQPNYPFRALQRDALGMTYEELLSFDVIHASPPCQAYSNASLAARRAGRDYPDLYHATLRMLVASGLPYIIENVPGSPVKGVRLWGDMFGLGVLRPRIFESNLSLTVPPRQRTGGSVKTGEYVTVAGNGKDTSRWADAMGMNWAQPDEIKEAIPPAYTEYLGYQMIEYLERVK